MSMGHQYTFSEGSRGSPSFDCLFKMLVQWQLYHVNCFIFHGTFCYVPFFDLSVHCSETSSVVVCHKLDWSNYLLEQLFL